MQRSVLYAGACILLSMLGAFAATPDQLYQTWQKSNIDQPEAAVKAAQDYLHAAPKGPHAHELQIWLDAYNSALASLLSNGPKSPPVKAAQDKPPPNKPAPNNAANAQVASDVPPANKPAANNPPPAPPPVQAAKPNPAPPPVQVAKAAPETDKDNTEAAVPPLPRPALATDKAAQTELASVAPQPRPEQEKPQPEAAPESSSGPKPLGQSLEETLAFIGDRVADAGTISFMAQFRNPATDYDLVEQLTYWSSGMTIDPNRCQVSFRWHVNQDGKGLPDQQRSIQLRLARGIRLETIDQALGALNEAAGLHYSVHAQPQIYTVHIDRIDNRAGDNLYFRDQETAASVVKAAQHAQDLCDGGK